MDGLALMQAFLETEVAHRQTRSLAYRLGLARLPQVKSLDAFECSHAPFDHKQLDGLATCEFIAHHSNLLLIGSSGSGKTHIALALASDLARDLLQAREHCYESRLMARLQRFHLIIIDEMGYIPIDPKAGSLIFELFSKLYEKNSLILTTHLAFDEWGSLFGNPKATQAMIDRITHHCTILETGNTSWRLKEGTEIKH